MEEELFRNIDKLHITPLGVKRIEKNLEMQDLDESFVNVIKTMMYDDCAEFSRRGKNWYVGVGATVFTINASSYTVITAHRR